jgi:hypothetical protein
MIMEDTLPNGVLSKDDAKRIYMACAMEDPDGLYADDVEIYELVDKIVQTVYYRAAKAERDVCVEVVRSYNPMVAAALLQNREPK